MRCAALDEQMRAAEQRVRDAADAEWRRGSAESNPFLAAAAGTAGEAEAEARAGPKSGDAARIAKAEAEVDQRRALLPS